MLLFSWSPRPHLEQSRYIHCFPIQPEFFFPALRREHGHAVGEFVAAGDLLSPQLIYYDGLAIADYCTGLGTGML